MHKFYTFVIVSIISLTTFGQGSESFTNTPTITTPASYVDRSWTGDNTLTWTAISGRTDSPTDAGLTGFTPKYIVIRNATGKISCAGINNGCADVTFTYARAYSGNGTIALFINGTQYGTTIIVSNTAATSVTIPVNVTGTFTLELRTSNSNRVAIDNIIWTATNSTPCTEPASTPTTLVFNTITTSSIAGSFTATTADKYLIVRATSNTAPTPIDGTAYAVNSAIGGGIVIANGTSTSFTDNGLVPNTTYYYFIYAFNDIACSGGANYNTTSFPTPNQATTLPLPSCTTPIAPSNPLTLTPSNTSVAVSFVSTSASKYLIIRSTALPPLGGNPTNGIVYTTGQTIGNGTVVTFTTNTNFVATGLTPATTYYFYVYAANDACAGNPPEYSTSSAEGNVTTTNNTGIPAGYYNAANGLTCGALKTALSNIITAGHTQNNYSGLDNIEMLTTDDRLNDAGTATIVWDMYSDNPTGPEPYTYTFAQAGSSATAEGQGWNKEHSFPNSWFSASSSTNNFPGADLFHLYPTDIRVNSLRGNLPYGNVPTATTTTQNGSKIGLSAIPFAGYSGQVFEPIDAYKGDLARGTLYMVTRYETEQATWQNLQPTGTVVMDGTAYPSVEIDYLKMLIQWHNADPVSTKELERNNTVYGFQGNRNPFIDNPSYVGQIWSTTCGLALPISLNNFFAKQVFNTVQLSWNATNAIGFSNFVVERSVDGILFTKVGVVNANNNINNTYNFTDVDYPKASIIYYRLKMVDANGTFKNSDIVSVKFSNNNSKILIYPNPTLGPISIALSQPINKNSTLQILDLTGRVWLQQQIMANATNINVNVKTLAQGNYFVKIINNVQTFHQSFMIAK